MAYPADPGAHFESDVHRRVLAHLSHPEDQYGWSLDALWTRIDRSAGAAFERGKEELDEVLASLEKSGFAEKINDVWRMTKEGLDKLQAEVPAHALPAAGDGVIGAATPIGEPVPEAPGAAGVQPAQIVPDTAPPAPSAGPVAPEAQ